MWELLNLNMSGYKNQPAEIKQIITVIQVNESQAAVNGIKLISGAWTTEAMQSHHCF